MSLKSCKSCFKEIDGRATKCPYCQAFQQKWRNPQVLAGLISLFFIPMAFLPLYFSGFLTKPKFDDYRKNVILTERAYFHDGADKTRFILELDNRTDKKWEDANVQILFKDANGSVIGVTNENVYNFKAPAKTKSLCEVNAHQPKAATAHEISLVSMRAPILND